MHVNMHLLLLQKEIFTNNELLRYGFILAKNHISALVCEFFMNDNINKHKH